MSAGHSLFVEYRVHWRAGGVRPGASRGTVSGPGERYRASVPLHTRADPRRLDVRASLRDPFAGIWVRDFEQNTALRVIVLADVSASMAYVGRHDKFAQLRSVAAALARTAWRNADAFGLFAANAEPQAALALPPRLNRAAADWVERRLGSFVPHGNSARGLLAVAAQLPQRRALVFVVSDFHWPDADTAELLRRLAAHAVVPVVLRDPGEADAIPRRGIALLRDLEDGRSRFVWLRPGLLRALQARRDAREHVLRDLCARAGCTPFFARGAFAPEALTRYFLETPV